MPYTPTIGLEIHAELDTKSKMFCSCKNDSREIKPNVNVCPVCLAHPGTLPVINKEAVKKVIKAGIALNCQINKETFFERKNYFYPDLPKGYQISQYALPLTKKGFLEIKGKKIRITRIHLEEDTGRLIHPKDKNYSLVDFNRAGLPLMELVTEADISSGRETKEFAKNLQLILRYLEVSKADMEKGEMRVEVNISLSKDKNKGTKVEIKNLNSIKAAGEAIDYEITRQKELLEKGKKIIQETRGWSDKDKKTFSQRKKEESHDYRYFTEPDLPPLKIEDDFLAEIKKEIPELPNSKRKRFKEQYGLDEKQIELYVYQKDLGEFFEKVVSELGNWLKVKKRKIAKKKFIKLASNYLTTDLQELLKEKSDFKEEDLKITPENFAELIAMVYNKEISSRIAKNLLKIMFKKGGDPSQIIKEENMTLIEDQKEIRKSVKEVIEENPKAMEDYNEGKKTVVKFLVGQVMRKTRGKADPKKIIEIIEEILS